MFVAFIDDKIALWSFGITYKTKKPINIVLYCGHGDSDFYSESIEVHLLNENLTFIYYNGISPV